MYGPARSAARVQALALPALAVVLAVLAGCASAAPRSASPRPAARGGPRCQRETISVALAAPTRTGSQARYQLAGWLCADGSPRGRAVQVLIPGLTYGASYWNFPLDPGRYSYVRAATAAGFATLALDRLGTGPSSHPPAAAVT